MTDYNSRTVRSYESIARSYAHSVAPDPQEAGGPALRALAELLPRGANVLEVGSGPGWDADFLETQGVTVRRTDVTQAFLDFQTERGKQADALDILVDEFGGPYDAVMALCVLQHVDRDATDVVLEKVARALHPGGLFLVSLREGEGEFWERGDSGGEYHTVLWSRDQFVERLRAAGLRVVWSERTVYSEGPWQTFLARR
jgi:SAM-dependent methyltransferase